MPTPATNTTEQGSVEASNMMPQSTVNDVPNSMQASSGPTDTVKQALARLRNHRMGMFFFHHPKCLKILKGDLKNFDESGFWAVRTPISVAEAKNMLADISVVLTA